MGTHPIFESDFDCLTEMERELQLETLLDEAIVELVVSQPSGYKEMTASSVMGILEHTQASNNIELPSNEDMQELISEIYRQNDKTKMLIDHVRDYLALKIHRNGSLY